MGKTYLDLLRPMGARDFVDVQTFIYVSCGGYDLLHEKSKTAKGTANSNRRQNTAGETVRTGYVNPNGQEVIRDTGERGSSDFARKYELKCRYCDQPYGANS